MKLPILPQSYAARRSSSFRGAPVDSSGDAAVRSPWSVFWLILHGLSCFISLVLGFRFSRLVFFLFFSSDANSIFYSTSTFQTAISISTSLLNFNSTENLTAFPSSHVVVGRHGILIRPWPHPNPDEVMKAHRIIERVQKEQRVQYGVKNARSLIVITPTYVRTFQALHLTGVMHCLMNVAYDLTWIVVEAGGTTNETASLIAKSGIRTIHVGFQEKMAVSWEDRHRIESRMRLQALRVVRDEKLDGVVMFGDDSNIHSMELFDEIQNVKWIGAFSVGILTHSGEQLSVVPGDDNNSPVPVLGPACNSSDHVVGWHTFNSLPYIGKTAKYIGDWKIVLPKKAEWAGFALNSRLVWEEDEDLPEWIKDFDDVAKDGEDDMVSPLALLKDSSMVEPLGSCGRKVLSWWLRVEARFDSKFPSGWIIKTPLKVTVPAKRTPWPDATAEFLTDENAARIEEKLDKRAPNTQFSRLRRSTS